MAEVRRLMTACADAVGKASGEYEDTATLFDEAQQLISRSAQRDAVDLSFP